MKPTMPDRAGDIADWQPLVDHYLSPLVAGGFIPADVDRAEQWSANATAFSATGSWRARIRNGRLWVKMIRVHSHWAERASVLRLLLLALKGSPSPPDSDFVYAHSDNDPTPPPSRRALQRCGRHKALRGRQCKDGRDAPRRLPLFTNSHNPRAGGIPLPEFTWVGWGEAVLPWCQQAATLEKAAASAPWATRDRRLFFSGGLDNGHHRKELRKLALAERSAGRLGELRIRDVSSRFHRWGQYDAKQPRDLHTLVEARNSSARAVKESLARMVVAPLPSAAACQHQYSINVPGFGYSSRLRALLQCGTAVVHVKHHSSEFFMPLLRNGTHLLILGGREPVRDKLLPLVRALHANSSVGAGVAAAGQAFARRWLALDAVVDYTRTMLRAYGQLYQRAGVRAGGHQAGAASRSPPPPPASTGKDAGMDGYVRVTSEADLPLVTGLCTSCARPAVQRHVARVCTTRESRLAKQRGGWLPYCKVWAPKGGGSCRDPRCCIGWDCGVRDLGCPLAQPARQ